MSCINLTVDMASPTRDHDFSPAVDAQTRLFGARSAQTNRRTDADRIDAHLALGRGSHFCLGASLARAELRIGARVLAQTISCPEIIDVEMRPPIGLAGPTRLTIDFEVR